MPTILLLMLALAGADTPEPLFPPLPEGETPRAQLVRYLDAIGHRQLRERREAVARIATREQLEARRAQVRETVLRLMGGLPTERTPLQPRVTGRRQGAGFSVENVIYESLPGFPVTANLYRPPGPGPFPAILASMGHSDASKAGERHGPDLARQGFVVLAYDPVGQGERLQHYDPELRASRAGGPTEEHGQAAARAELVGDSVARYFVWDAMRGLDYLASLAEVDPRRLGAVGCSGGGTITTYLAALDERVQAAAVACYVTSWDALLDGPGPQEAEQTLAGFLTEGLDMADYLALIAPRPLLVASTREDFFPLAGAGAVVDEARRYYALLGDAAGERLSWSVGPGGHGLHREGREAVAAFFQRWLRGGEGDPRDLPDARLLREDLDATPTGQVATSLRARSVADLVAKRAAAIEPTRRLPPPRPVGAVPPLVIHRSQQRAGYQVHAVSFEA
ncbi:MAG TPA: acetylxylan esterase, partial [Vicinamibacteria bacterium]